MINKVKVKLTQDNLSWGHKGDEIEVFPNEARELFIQGRIEGDEEDFLPENFGQHGMVLHEDRLVDQPSREHDHSHVDVDDDGVIVGVRDFEDDEEVHEPASAGVALGDEEE